MRARDLALPGAAGQLLEDLADLEQRRGLRRVAERQAPAAAVDVVELAAGDGGRRLAGPAQAHRLVGHELGVGERAVDLEHVELLSRAPGALERLVGRLADPRIPSQRLAERDVVGVVVALAPAGQGRARPPALARHVLGADDDRRRPVGPRRRLELVDRRADDARGEHLVDGERLAQLGARVACGVGAQAHAQLGDGGGLDRVVVEVALGGQRVERDDGEEAQRAQVRAEARVHHQRAIDVALVQAVGEQVALDLRADDRGELDVAQRDVLAGGLEGQQGRGAAALDLDHRARGHPEAFGEALWAQGRDGARVAGGHQIEPVERADRGVEAGERFAQRALDQVVGRARRVLAHRRRAEADHDRAYRAVAAERRHQAPSAKASITERTASIPPKAVGHSSVCS